MGFRKRLARLFCGLAFLLPLSQHALAYRPFDFTDAAVADVGELETELGPAAYRIDPFERTVLAPVYVLNLGYAKDWELVLEGRGEHPQSPPVASRWVGNGLFLKGVLREGVLQEKTGPSVATEFGVLLPGIRDEPGIGASWFGIVSQRWSFGTIHFNVGAELTHEQRGDLSIGSIIEGPFDWTIRPVAEVRYEREFGRATLVSGLVGAIWRVKDDLALDAGVREAWINHHRQTEFRAGLTFAVSAW